VRVDTLKGLFPIILITIVVFIAAGLVTLTDGITSERIRLQEEQQIEEMLKEMFPNFNNYTFEDDIYVIYSGETRAGFAFLASGQGYGGKISILVGIENDMSIKGVNIISQSETPGLGDRITESFFTDKFIGMNISDVKLNQDGGQIDAITCSTISSAAVIDAIRTTGLEKIKSLPDE